MDKITDSIAENILGTDYFLQKEKEMNNFISELFKKYKKELENFNLIPFKETNLEAILKLGGKISYFDMHGSFYYGGILVKISKNQDYTYLLLKNKYKIWKIRTDKHILYYKPHTTQSDNMRKFFLNFIAEK